MGNCTLIAKGDNGDDRDQAAGRDIWAELAGWFFPEWYGPMSDSVRQAGRYDNCRKPPAAEWQARGSEASDADTARAR